MDRTYEPKPIRITEKREVSADTVILRLASQLNPLPGQFIQASFLGIGECPLSVCSYSPNYIDVMVRKKGNVTSKIFGSRRGSHLMVRGPYGNGYPMADMAGKNINVIASGLGIASPASLLHYIQENREKYHNVQVFIGFANPQEILCREEIESWSKQYNLVLTVDKCADPTFSGRVCYVTEAFGEADIIPENSAVVLGGHDTMLRNAIRKLKAKGFSGKQIYLSMERHMKCGIGKCGHCTIKGVHVCKDGPVFTYDAMGGYYE